MTAPDLMTADEIALNLDERGQNCRICGSHDVFEKQDGDELNHQCASCWFSWRTVRGGIHPSDRAKAYHATKKKRPLKPKSLTQIERRRLLVLHHANKRRALKLRAMPAWADAEMIRAVYDDAARLQRETGTTYHVDHIVPLQGKDVCGLHVHFNLRAIPAAAVID